MFIKRKLARAYGSDQHFLGGLPGIEPGPKIDLSWDNSGIDDAKTQVVLWRLRFRVIGGHAKTPSELRPMYGAHEYDSPLLRLCRAHASTDRDPALEPSPARHEPRDRSNANGIPEAGYSEGLRAQIHQKLRITNPSTTFQLPLAD
jgi:hypothetical protein